MNDRFWSELLLIFIFLSPQVYCEQANHPDEIKPKPSVFCKGPLCFPPFPRLCAEPRPACVWFLPPTPDFGPPRCKVVSVLDCACPPPMKSLYEGSLQCCYKSLNFSQIYTTQYAVPFKEHLLTALDPSSTLEVMLLDSHQTKVDCKCLKLHDWCEWGQWSMWTDLCTANATQYRHRSRGCCDGTKSPTNEAHYCVTRRNGDPLDERTQIESKPSTRCPRRHIFLNPKEGQRLSWTDYLLLLISVLLLIVIVCTIILIVKTVKL